MSHPSNAFVFSKTLEHSVSRALPGATVMSGVFWDTMTPEVSNRTVVHSGMTDYSSSNAQNDLRCDTDRTYKLGTFTTEPSIRTTWARGSIVVKPSTRVRSMSLEARIHEKGFYPPDQPDKRVGTTSQMWLQEVSLNPRMDRR